MRLSVVLAALVCVSTVWAQQSEKPPQAKDAMEGMDMGAGRGKVMPGMHSALPGTTPPNTTPDTAAPGLVPTFGEAQTPAPFTHQLQPAPNLLKALATQPSLSLASFLHLADTRNPTLAEANALVRRAAAQARQAGLYPNPSIGYEGEQIRGGSYGGGEQGAFVQQPVILGGKLGLRRNIYNQQKLSDQIGVEEQVSRIHNDVTQAFYTALASQATVAVREKLLAVAEDAVRTSDQLANVGQADAPDVLQAEVEAEQAKVDYVTAQRDYLHCFKTLATLSGQPELVTSYLAGSLDNPPALDTEKQVTLIVSESPSVKRMQQEVATRRAQLRDAKRESMPDLEVKAGEQYNNERLGEAPAKATGPQSFASVGINVPLWNRNQGNVSAAHVEVDRALQEVSRVQLLLRQQAEASAQAYLSAQYTADTYRTRLIPKATKAYQLYLDRYQNMAMAYPQVLVSQRTLFQLQIGYVAALREAWVNAVALQNFNLTGALDSPVSTGGASTAIHPPDASTGAME